MTTEEPTSPKYTMTLSLSVLDDLGRNLYSSIPAVISEVVANAWDADATQVDILVEAGGLEIVISDDGVGMDLKDINEKYLTVGFRRRSTLPTITPRGRHVMGRKGIGKLSLFAIANTIALQTKRFLPA